MLLPIMALCSIVAAAEDWIWLAQENIISNSVWSLRAYEKDGELYMGVKGQGSNSKRGLALTARGAGDLDLSQPVVSIGEGGETKNWSIVGFEPYAFAIPEDGETTVTSVIFPTTTKYVPGYVFRGRDATPSSTVLTNVVMIVPEFEGTLGAWAFCRNRLKKVLVKAPKMVGIEAQAFNCSMGETDFNEWDLSSLTTMENCAFGWNSVYGTLTLPSVKKFVDNALLSSKGHTNIVMGTAYKINDKVELDIGDKAFYENKSLERLTFGPYSSIRLANTSTLSNYFHSCQNIKSVEFQGGVLANAAQVLDAVFYHAKTIDQFTKANQAVVYGSRNLGWGEIAKEPTQAELALLPDGIPAADLMGVYETQNGERKAWVVHRASEHEYDSAITLSKSDDRFNDTYEIVSGDVKNGNPRVGTEITIRAVCDETTFRAWEGLPEGAVVNGTEATFVLPLNGLELTLKTSPKWTYLPDEGVISNRVWKLNVTRNGLVNGRLRIGLSDWQMGGASAYTGMGEGILDLSGEITDEGGAKWIITHLGPYAMAVSADYMVLTNPVTKLIFPRETESIEDGFMRSSIVSHDGTQHSNVVSRLSEVLMDVPNLKKGTGNSTFLRQTKLKKIYVNAPQLTKIGAQVFNCGSGLDYTDTTLWNVTNVCVIESAAFGWCWSGYGHFKLNSLTNIASAGLLQMKNTALDLGTRWAPKDRQYLTVGSDTSFGDMTAVTSVVFGAYTKLVTTATTPFDFKNLKEVRYLGRVPENVTQFVDGVLKSRGVPDSPTKYAAIRASHALGWDKIASPVTPAETVARDAFEATLDPTEFVMGVYVNGDNNRVAWLVHAKSPHDPNGTVLILR